MSEDRDIAAAFTEGLEPVLDATPPFPEWESLQFEPLSPVGRSSQWWVAAVAAVLVIVVGGGSLLLAGRFGGSNDETSASGDNALPGGSEITAPAADVPASIEGRWILESWQDGGDRIVVEVGVNADDEPWLEFTSTFEGELDTFVSADGTGTAGTFVGSTGCNAISPTDYEYSAEFLVLGQAVVPAGACSLSAVDEGLVAEDVLLAMLSNTPDGIEVIMGSDRMEWFGSNLEGKVYPLVFRRVGSPPLATTDGTSTTTTLEPEQGLAMRVYEVDGIEVVTPSFLDELPEQATRVEFHTTVIDSGNGPELCTGIVLDSLPPQCSGPVAAGLDMDGWSEEASGVRWGERSVVVTWPPVDGFVEVLDQSQYAPPALEYPPGDLPAECENTDTGAGAGPVNEYANSLGDNNGGLYVTNDGTLVLQVVGDAAPHREAMAELGGACVVEVSRNAAEQRTIQEALHPLIATIAEVVGSYVSSPGPAGRVDLELPVVDRATARAIAELADDPTAIRIIGTAVLHP
jgi:hypothetical protein